MHMRLSLIIAIVAIGSYGVVAAPTVKIAIDKSAALPAGQIAVVVTVENVTDLDTYSFDAEYDTTKLSLLSAGIEVAVWGLKNVLKSGSATVLPALKKLPGHVNIAATKTGNVKDSVSLSGVIGVMVFRKKAADESLPTVSSLSFLDSQRKPIEAVVVTSSGTAVGGDR